MKTTIAQALICSSMGLLCACTDAGGGARYPKARIDAECRNSVLKVGKQLRVSDIYVDRTYLRIMTGVDRRSDVNEIVELLFRM